MFQVPASSAAKLGDHDVAITQHVYIEASMRYRLRRSVSPAVYGREELDRTYGT